MIDHNTPEIKFALHAVRQAALLVEQVQSEMVTSALTKDDRSPVTIADFASQALVAYLLAKTFPDDPLVAEEDSFTLQKPEQSQTLEQISQFVSRFTPPATPETICEWIDRGNGNPAQRFWTLDPIDGTKGFLRANQYAVALALIQGGEVQLGVLGCPNLSEAYLPDHNGPGSLVLAARGQGAWTTSLSTPGEFNHLTASQNSNPITARLLRSFESGHTNVSQIDQFALELGVEAEPLRMDSQAKYAVLAAGKGDLLLRLLSPSMPNYREKIWDQAAGSIVIEEAGGRITDLKGKALDFTAGRTLANNRGILASNAHLHTLALNALQTIST
ncbi:MAG: 3'(2'),5'-bisphosphate nucleotidase [Anaerolineales bacterium]|jgi:3'(2'), 5'-bisphosphate nucleotidase